MTDLTIVMNQLRTSIAIRRKKAISPPLQVFSDIWNINGEILDPIGDDAAVIISGEDYLLFSSDSILPQLVEEEPFWAGYCAVLVSVSDIYAMGGRPIAVVNLLSASDEATAVSIAEGMAEGCKKLGVPMVGGHFQPEEKSAVGTAIIGRATHLLRATEGQPGHSLVVALDLTGERYKHYLQWNSTTMLEPQILQKKLAVLPRLAEAGLTHAARDISNAGLIGTIAMLAENANCGAAISIDKLPKPTDVEWGEWLQIYPGYGFVLSVEKENEEIVKQWFSEEGIHAEVVGCLTEERLITVTMADEVQVYMDLEKESLVVG